MLVNSLTKEEKVENFFQMNFVWLLMGVIIAGAIIAAKGIVEMMKDRTERECNLLLSGSLLGLFSFYLSLASAFLWIVDPQETSSSRDWESIKTLYLISVGVLFVGYTLRWMGNLNASSQKLKISQKNLKKEIERQKEKIKIS